MTTTIYDVLDELWTTATDEHDKGSKFERLMAAYLRTDPQYVDRFSDVWLWMDWPGRDGKPDTGIDLVAQERESGELTAIQCKFYNPAATLPKSELDSFFTASGKAGFSSRMVVSTTDNWSKHAEDALHGQQIPVTRLRVQDLENSGIDWAQFSLKTPELLPRKGPKEIRPHQVEALAKVQAGFQAYDRGKLIMACGTGKTFTSLQIVQDHVPVGGTVLFLVPSISLLSQTLREWTLDADVGLRPFVVCSDTKVGKGSEDISPVDLAYPATTDPAKLHSKMAKPAPDRITVVFSTYQSLPVVAAAQEMGLGDFDLIICDEAHRTTGVTLVDEDESNFVKVHDNTFLKATKRLYMTATPRIYDDTSKSKADQGGAELASMDDESTYGPEFHRLGFGEAVERGLLTDYKVLVLAVDEAAVSRTFQQQLADANTELKLDDAAKIVGCWNGLAKRGLVEHDFTNDPSPMQRAVAFSRSIKDSQKFADLFKGIIDTYVDSTDLDSDSDESVLRCEVEHVDGTFNVLKRSERLDWLKAPIDPDTCRVLTNVRCLGEGVDVPALDSVMFLNPRNSVVDVVQSVGRVMRLAPGKKYGYVILPIGIPAGLTPEKALADNKKYKVVWQVLQALRAHDERFNAMVNKIELNKEKDKTINVIGVGAFNDDGESEGTDLGKAEAVQGTLSLSNLADWRDAIYAKIVQKVGDRAYWEDWASSVKDIADAHVTRITALLDDPDFSVQAQFEEFLEGLRGNLNDAITRVDAIDMLAQHLITRPVFDALFEGYSFAEHNPVSRVMETMLATLDEHNLAAENDTLDKFYASVRLRAEGIDNAEGKQRIITELYERFFKIAFPRVAASLGIVYTPVEIVDFIIRSVEHVLNTEFDASISDEGVHVLDPFTGTGTFIVRLLQSGLIKPEDLLRKYASELHANEILLLAYYIAAINIEATFHGITSQTYEPFNGVVLTDTFQMTEDDDTRGGVMFPQNNARLATQKALDIRVIIGNPPYSAGQTSANDANANLKYPTLDASIARTYAKRSTATNKNSLYDSYIRAFRWASNRIQGSEHGGVIGFVTNGGYINSNTADGLRKTLADEFHAIYVFNLRGNSRTAGDIAKREGGNVFNVRVGIAVIVLVKKPGTSPGAILHYRDIGGYLTREDKLTTIDNAVLDSIDWQLLTPNAAGDWIDQRSDTFTTFMPIGAKTKKGEAKSNTVFDIYSAGLQTNRDAWVYNFSHARLVENVNSTIAFFNEQSIEFHEWCRLQGIGNPRDHGAEFVNNDATRISWSSSLVPRLERGEQLQFSAKSVVSCMYRPFSKQAAYFDAALNHRRSLLPQVFPTPDHDNYVIVAPQPGASAPPWFALMTGHILDSGAVGISAAVVFPRYTYEPSPGEVSLFDGEEFGGLQRLDNTTDEALERFQAAYGAEVSKDDIFFYVYGLLHSPIYRTAFAADLKKMLPRLPLVASTSDFEAFAKAGRDLSALHLGYESVEPYPLGEAVQGSTNDSGDLYRVMKMRFGKTGKEADKSTIVYNSHIILSGIPDQAHDYMLGSRSAIEWIMDRYQVKTDKDSGIVNDPNDWCDEVGDPRYIVDLVKRIVTVSVETVEIVNSLPDIDFSTAKT